MSTGDYPRNTISGLDITYDISTSTTNNTIDIMSVKIGIMEQTIKSLESKIQEIDSDRVHAKNTIINISETLYNMINQKSFPETIREGYRQPDVEKLMYILINVCKYNRPDYNYYGPG